MNLKLKSNLEKILDKLKISDNKYYLQEAYDILIKISEELFYILNNELKKYNWLELHCLLLDSYSRIFNDMSISNSRENIDDAYMLQKLTYFIELNLIYKYEGKNAVTENECGYLFSITQFLFHLQEIRAIINFTKSANNNDKAKNFKCIDIDRTRDEIIQFPSSKEYEEQYKLYRNKYYDNYIIMSFEKSKKLFEDYKLKDTIREELNIDYFLLNMILENIEELFSNIKNVKIKSPYKYVLEMSYDEFVFQILCKYKGKVDKDYLNNLENAAKFIILDTEKITYIKGEKENYLSIDKIKSRENRFDIKPIIKINNEKLIFSFEAMKIAGQKWLNCIEEFYFPYDFNIPKSKKLLDKLKNEYEDRFSVDIENLLKGAGYTTLSEVFFHKRLNDNTLEYLGDYDVIAVDNKNNIIIIVEAKFIGPSIDISKLLSQQEEYYGRNPSIEDNDINHKESLKHHDEKFQRRINYLKNNYKDILPKINLNIDIDKEYKIKPFMIFNRHFKPLFKNLNFEVLSFNEFKELLENNKI